MRIRKHPAGSWLATGLHLAGNTLSPGLEMALPGPALALPSAFSIRPAGQAKRLPCCLAREGVRASRIKGPARRRLAASRQLQAGGAFRYDSLGSRMKLPPITIIPIEKATRYLLVPQARGDKSAFLERAGYTRFVTLLPDKRRIA